MHSLNQNSLRQMVQCTVTWSIKMTTCAVVAPAIVLLLYFSIFFDSESCLHQEKDSKLYFVKFFVWASYNYTTHNARVRQLMSFVLVWWCYDGNGHNYTSVKITHLKWRQKPSKLSFFGICMSRHLVCATRQLWFSTEFILPFISNGVNISIHRKWERMGHTLCCQFFKQVSEIC